MQRDIRLIATDLDGTLLEKGDRVHPDNIEALKRCRDLGIKVCPVTARNWKEVAPVLRQVEFDQVCALNNGACLAELPNGKVKQEVRFSPEQVAGMVQTILELSMTFLSLMGFDYMHVIEGGGRPSWFSNYTPDQQAQMGIRMFPDAKAMLAGSTHVQRLTCGVEKQAEELARKALDRMQAAYGCRAMYMEEADGDYIEISPARVDKAHAMLALCRCFDVRPEQVLAFGDNENDWGMLRQAGVSVAMGNASEETKQIATMVTSGNREGGVAAALRSLVL